MWIQSQFSRDKRMPAIGSLERCRKWSSFSVAAALFCLFTSPIWQEARAQPASLAGYIIDATSGETLLTAHVRLDGTDLGAATNNAGYYALAGLQPGTYTVIASYIGFRSERIEVELAPGEERRLDIELQPQEYRVGEITVTADEILEEETRRVGVMQLQTDLIRQLPAVLQPDVFRSLQLLPGIKAASDYSSGLYIRGGSPDQTLILLDRTTVYNPSHFFGFFSTFNPDAIKDVRVYKGGFPANYGGRLGAVVDIYNRDGNRREFEGGLSIGLLSSSVVAEGPYSRGSYMIALRRSTLEPLLYALRKSNVEGIPDAFHFVDANGKVNLDLSGRDRISLAFYTGRDALDIEFLDDAHVSLVYGNRTISLNWTHLFSQKLFSTFTATGSEYQSKPDLELSGTSFSQRNRVGEASIKGDFEYIANDQYTAEVGFWSGVFAFGLRNLFDGEETLDESLNSLYTSVYLQNTYRPASSLTLRGGVRVNYFEEGSFVRLAPRLSADYVVDSGLRLQAAYGRYYQFLTLITSELFSGFDTWLTTGDGVPPAFGDQFVLGAKTNLGDFDLDVETYYRTMRDLFELDPNVPDPAGLDYVDLFHFGDGYAYGFEALLRRPRGRVNGFLAYTWSRTQRRFPDVNEGAYYTPKYDRTHDIHLVANVDLSRVWRLNAVWSFASGQAYTRPLGRYQIGSPFESADWNVLVTEHNNDRLPPYHRLDVGITRRGTMFGSASYEFSAQVINLYSRRNTWFYFYDFSRSGEIDRTEVPQIPVPVPNLSFTLRF